MARLPQAPRSWFHVSSSQKKKLLGNHYHQPTSRDNQNRSMMQEKVVHQQERATTVTVATGCSHSNNVLSPSNIITNNNNATTDDDDNVIDYPNNEQDEVGRSNIPSLVCAFLASGTTGGTTYAFGLYSNALKHSLSLTQTQLDTVSTCFFFAGLFSFISGYCSDHYGTRFALILGGILSSIFLLWYWMIATQYIEVHSYLIVPLLSVLGIFIFLSSALITGAVFKIISSCCGLGTKGNAVGIAKGYVGLGAGLYSCIFDSLRNAHNSTSSTSSSDLDFLLMASTISIFAVIIPGILLLPSKSTTMKNVTYIDETTSYHFYILFISLLIMAIFIIGKSILSLSNNTNHKSSTHDNHNNTSPTALFLASSSDSEEDLTSSIDNDISGITKYIVAFFLVTIWAGPILTLLFLPRSTSKQQQQQRFDIIPAEEDEILEDNNINDDHNNDIHFLDRNPVIDVEESRSPHPLSNNDPLTQNSIIEKDILSTTRTKYVQEKNNLSSGLLIRKNSIVETTRLQQSLEGESDSNTENDTNALLPRSNNNHPLHNNVDLQDEDKTTIRNLNLFQMIQTPSAILMLFTSTILVGSGTVITNNVGQMVESLQFSTSTVTPAATAIFSVAQSFGRIVTGIISESALNWNITSIKNTCCILNQNGIPRPFFFIISSIMACMGHIVMATIGHKTQSLFVFGISLIGISFGMVWPLLVLVVGEIFGIQHVGANYMFYDGFSSAIGTLILSKMIAQNVYETHIIHNNNNTTSTSMMIINDESFDKQHTCIGIDCFQQTHIIISILAFCCILTSLCLLYTSKQTYNNNIKNR